ETEDEANDLYEQIKNGADFAELAMEHSLCPSKRDGGDLRFFGKGMMVKPFEDACFSMEVGDVSEPVETQFGWHLIKLTDKK
ncbi:MAG TPA: peptidylprolyl isomerase, partial [Cyanobacteria bacterium UBA11991]|nr:peptidylprolyl isomerase [Cyanobacteria bacterium UBA11991]